MPNKSQSILLAGAAIGVAGVISGLIPVVGGCLVCILYVAAGLVAVWHYTDRHQLTIKGGQGLSLGALAGLVAAVVSTVLNALLEAIGLKPDWQEQAMQGMEESGMDPSQLEQMQEIISSPLAFVGVVLLGLVVAALLGAVGGAIGANVFKRETEFFNEETESDDLA